MPCYLFTYHTYGSWMPDRKQGYVARKQGLLPPDKDMARLYRSGTEDAAAALDDEQQLLLINTLIEGVRHIGCRLHAVATDPSHAHALVSWLDESRGWTANRSSLKKAITFALQGASDRKRWLSEGASRKRVRDRKHFDYLMDTYLPSHRGWKWDERRGLFKHFGEA